MRDSPPAAVGSSPAAVALVGAGGHAKVCREAIRSLGGDVAGCFAAEPPAQGVDALYLGSDADLASAPSLGITHVCLAVGDNGARRRLADAAEQAGLRLLTIVHAAAIVAGDAALGAGVVVMAGAIVNPAVVIGRGVIINTGAIVEHDATIGDFAHIAPAAALGGGVSIGDSVLVGLGARVLPGVRIGDGAIVGAGAVVVSDVPAGAVVVGVPARIRPAAR